MATTTANVTRRPYRKDYTGDNAPYRGDTFTDGFSITTGGVAENLSGDTFRMQIRDAATDEEVHDLEIGTGITVSGNTVTFTLTAAQMRALPLKLYVYDIEWTRSTGVVKTLQVGTIQPWKDTTRP